MAIINVAGLATAPVVQLIDEGVYLAQIVSAEPVVSKGEKQTPGIKFDFVVVQGAIQQNGSDPTGRHVFWTLWIPNEGAGRDIGLQRLAKLCRVTGIVQSDELNTDEFIEKQVIITVKHRTMSGGDPVEDISNFREVRAE